MANITTINGEDNISSSRTTINTNFSNLNSDKIETSYLDTDTSLSANSDSKIATQKAVKTYIDTQGGANASETVRGIVEEATDAEVAAGTAIGATGAKLFITPEKLANLGLSKSVDVQKYTTEATKLGSTDSQYDVTKSGDTIRYTWDGNGTNPGITAGTVPVGSIVDINTDSSFSRVNCGAFIVTASGTNYFEVTNPQGVAENDRQISSTALFVSTLTWTKPTGAKAVQVICIGAGGAGGGGRTRNAGLTGRGPGSGGGGGARTTKMFNASDLTSTVPVIVAKAPVGGTAGNRGENGGNSAFGEYLIAFGGGGGYPGAGVSASGGSGGGSMGNGLRGATTSVNGGFPNTGTGVGVGNGGAGSISSSSDGQYAENGGASGSGISSDSGSVRGGSSWIGGGGGGSGGGIDSLNPGTSSAGGAGGKSGSYTAGGGGAGGSVQGGNGTAGTSRSGFGCGDGGGGGAGHNSANGGGGGAGGAPGGGGGGGGAGTSPNGVGGTGGDGGRGEVIVITYF